MRHAEGLQTSFPEQITHCHYPKSYSLCWPHVRPKRRGGGGGWGKKGIQMKKKTKPKTCPFSREQKYWCMCFLEYKLFPTRFTGTTHLHVFFFFLVSFTMVTMGGD